MQVLLSVLLMALHRQQLSFRLPAPLHPQPHTQPPHLKDVIRSTISYQIQQHQHIAAYRSPQQALIQQTRTILSSQRNHRSEPAAASPRVPTSDKRATASGLRGRAQRRGDMIRRQAELMAQIEREAGREKVKRYREQIEQQEAEIEMAISEHRVRRSWLTPTAKPKRRQRQSQTLRQSERKEREERKEEDEWTWEQGQRTTTREVDEYIMQKLAHPYRRLLLQRGRGRLKVQPWHASLPV